MILLMLVIVGVIMFVCFKSPLFLTNIVKSPFITSVSLGWYIKDAIVNTFGQNANAIGWAAFVIIEFIVALFILLLISKLFKLIKKLFK